MPASQTWSGLLINRTQGAGDDEPAKAAQEDRSHMTDVSGLVPHSQRWLEYWDRQIVNYMSDPEHRRPAVLFPIDAFRAVMKFTSEPASLVGSIPAVDE
jgi:hypothetical protein